MMLPLSKMPRIVVFALALGACSDNEPQPRADTVLRNGVIYTADGDRSMAQALAIVGDRIAYVGDDAGAEAWIGEQTDVVDLKGTLVLPGLHDVHLHPEEMIDYGWCSLDSEPMTLAGIAATVRACADAEPDNTGLLVVDMWNFAEGNEPDQDHPTMRAALDAATGERPVYVRGNDGHHGGANSLLLASVKSADGAVVGLNAGTLRNNFQAYRAFIGVDAAGEPNGMIHEDARNLVIAGGESGLLSVAEMLARSGQLTTLLNSRGITSIQDASAEPESYVLFDHLYETGALTLRVGLNQKNDPEDFKDPVTGGLDLNAIMSHADAIRARYAGHPLIKADGLKIVADGVIEGDPFANPPLLPNAAQLAPYKQPIFSYDNTTGKLDLAGYVDLASLACEAYRNVSEMNVSPYVVGAFQAEHGYHPDQCRLSSGVLESPEEFIRAYADAGHAAGYTLHIHVIGDRAARVAVEAIADAREKHGVKGLPHGLAHIQFVRPDDIRKIGEQGLYLAYTYAWALTSPAYDMTVMPFVDEIKDQTDLYRDEYYSYRAAYPVKSTLEAGAILVAGSDAPVDTKDPRPLMNIEQAVTRAGADGSIYNPRERISIRDVIDAYTINGAVAMRQADITGSLEVGKKADIVVLDQNIIALADSGEAERIDETKVLRTYFDGVVVYIQ